MFPFIVTLRFNINMTCFELSLLLIDGDIESNPGPAAVVNKIQKVVLGSCHQGHLKFGDTAGIQCSCNALYAIFFSVIIWEHLT